MLSYISLLYFIYEMINYINTDWVYNTIDFSILLDSFYDLYFTIFMSISLGLIIMLILSSTIFIGLLILLL